MMPDPWTEGFPTNNQKGDQGLVSEVQNAGEKSCKAYTKVSIVFDLDQHHL